MIQRVVHLGFEVRVELLVADGSLVSAQITREAAEQLELTRKQIVYTPAPHAHLRRGGVGAPES